MTTLVFLHGFTGQPTSFDAVIAALRPEGTALRPALLGHTGSSSTAEHWDDAVAELAAELRSRAPLALVGYSLGGRVALGLLAAFPELVAQVTIIGAHLGLRTEDERETRRVADARWVELLRREGIEAFAEAWANQPLFATQARLGEDLRDAARRARLAHDALGLARSLEVLGLAEMPDLRPALASADVPVDVVVGGLDTKFLPLAREATRLLARGRLHVVPDVGHNVPLEAPDALAAILRGAPFAGASEGTS